MRRLLLSAALIGIFGASAEAATQCGPRADVLAMLAKKFEERPVAIGLSGNGRLLEILARDDGRTWTVVSTSPEGLTCVLDAGEEWHFRQLAAIGPEA